MARGRILSKMISEDEVLNQCSEEAVFLYLHSLPHLDRDGLITGHPLLLWRLALPLRHRYRDLTGSIIAEWVKAGVVIAYTGRRSEPVLFFEDFRICNPNLPYSTEKASLYPPPPGWIRTRYGLVPEDNEARLALLAYFDTRSSYRAMLIAPDVVDDAAESAPPLAKSARRLRGSREVLAYQDQRKDQGKVQTGDDDDSHSSSPACVEGGVWGGDGGGVAYLTAFGRQPLHNAALDLGPLVFGADFMDYQSFLAESDEPSLALLLEWISYFWHNGNAADKIRDPAAYIRTCLKKQDRPNLTRPARSWLRQHILETLEV